MQHLHLISDSNIIIDMEVAGLIELIFQLPYIFAVPDILYHEELRKQHSHLPALGLRCMPMTPDMIIEGMRLASVYKKAGRIVLLALSLSKSTGYPLLTGDMALRKAATEEAVQPRGTLWLIEQLVSHQLITKQRALDAYQTMKINGRRLPWADAIRRIKKI